MDAAFGAGGFVVGAEDHPAGGEGDAQGEHASGLAEVEVYDAAAVSAEGVRGAHEGEAARLSWVRGGEAQSEDSAVGVTDEDWSGEADALDEVVDEGGEVRLMDVELFRTVGWMGGEKIDGYDATVCGEAGDEFCECFGGGQQRVQQEDG